MFSDIIIEGDVRMIKNNMNENYNKSKGNKVIIFVIVFCVIGFLIMVGSIIWVVKSGKFDFIFDNIKEEKVELKHTDSVKTKSEGVYITDVSDVVDKVMPSIVAITSKTVINSGQFGPSFFGEGYTAEGAGSGVIVYENDSDIFVLTNNHVVENSKQLSVRFIDDKSYDATVKGVSERRDIAIVSISKKVISNDTLKAIKIATLGDSSKLKVGNGIIAIGNALGYGQSVTTGVVSALNREVSTEESVQDMIQIDAAINGGNSGGALLNSNGEVVGINTAKYSSGGLNSGASVEGMGFAIPISEVETLIQTLIKGENDTKALLLGIQGYMTDTMATNYNLPQGLYIAAINSGSNADKAGLEIGNIITKIDDTTVDSIDDIRKVLNKKEKGDTAILKIKYASGNEYKEKEVKVTLN